MQEMGETQRYLFLKLNHFISQYPAPLSSQCHPTAPFHISLYSEKGQVHLGYLLIIAHQICGGLRVSSPTVAKQGDLVRKTSSTDKKQIQRQTWLQLFRDVCQDQPAIQVQGPQVQLMQIFMVGVSVSDSAQKSKIVETFGVPLEFSFSLDPSLLSPTFSQDSQNSI